MEEIVIDMLEPMIKYIAITFLGTEVLKQIIKSASGYKLEGMSIIISFLIATTLSYGWALNVLPDPEQPGFEYVAIFLTGLIIAGAASGLFSWLKELSPEFEELQE